MTRAGTNGAGTDAPPSRGALIGAFAAIYLVWGSTYLAIRFALESLPPFLLAGSRFLAAGAILYAWCRLRGAPRPEPSHWRASAVSGFLMLFMGVGGVTWSEQFVPSGLVALTVAMVPLWLSLIAWAGPDGVRPGIGEAVGIVLGLAGVGLLVAPGADVLGEGSIPPLPALVLLVGSVAWAAGSLYGRTAPRPGSHLFGVALTMVAGGAWLSLVGVLAGELGRVSLPDASALSLLSLLYLVVFGSIVAFSAYVWLLRVAPPAQVGTYAFVNPVVAVLLGWALASEPLSLRVFLAMTVIVAGVALIVWRRPRRAPHHRTGAPQPRPSSPRDRGRRPGPSRAPS